MAEFTYTTGEESNHIIVAEEHDPRRLVYEVEKTLLGALEEKGLEIDPHDKRYLQSRIAIAITRDLLSKKSVDLGFIKTRAKHPDDGGDVYTLINAKDGKLDKRSYSPDQSIGAVIADIRRLYDLGLNDNITVAQVINGERREVSSETRVSELASRELYWDTKPYE